MNTQRCPGYGTVAAHDGVESDFSKGKTRCRACTSLYFKDWAAKKRARQQPLNTRRNDPTFTSGVVMPTPDEYARGDGAGEVQPVEPTVVREVQNIGKRDIGHTYRADPKLVRLWQAIVKSSERGDYLVLALHGPRGSGKTDGAEHLAALAERPLVKIDAKSIVDAEAWFGTRGAVEGSTFYHPSEFVKALQMRCVIFIDEYTRVTNEVRDVLNPLADGSRTVMNPITGDRISMHPEALVIFSGNVGYKYTGVFDVDPATTSRLSVFNVDYAEPEVEKSILREHAGITEGEAQRLVALAVETRVNPQMDPVSTRQLVQAAVLIRDGLSETEAVEAKIINAASDQGDGNSLRARLATLWGGIANTDAPKGVNGDNSDEDEVAQ